MSFRCLGLALDDLSGVLSDTVDGCLNVSSDVQRNHRGVDNTQIHRTVDLEARVDDTALFARKHRCGSDRVVLSDRGGLGVVGQVDVSRPVLADDHVAVGLAEGNFAGVVGSSGGNFDVEGDGEVLRVDQGVLGRVRGLDVNVTTREQVLVGSENRKVALVRLGDTSSGKVAVNTDELHLTDLVRVVVEEIKLLLQSSLVWSLGGVDVLGNIGDHRLGTLGTDNAGKRNVRDRRNGLSEDGRLVCLVSSSLLSSEGLVGAERVERLESRLEVEDGSRVGVVLEVLTDVGVLVENIDASLLENILGTDTGKLEELGSVDGTTGKDDFLGSVDSVGLTVAGESNTAGPVATTAGVKVDLGNESVGQNIEVRTSLVGEEVSRGRVGTSVVGGVDVRRLLRNTDVLTGERLVVLGDAQLKKSRDPSANLLRDVVGESNLDRT